MTARTEDLRLESLALKAGRTVLLLRLPAVACAAAAVGTQIGLAVGPDGSGPVWGPPAFLALAIGWAFLASRVAGWLWPARLTLKDVASSVGLVRHGGRRWAVGLFAGAAAVGLLGVPGPVGVVAAFALAALAPPYLRAGVGGVRVGLLVLGLVGGGLIAVLVLVPFTGPYLTAAVATVTLLLPAWALSRAMWRVLHADAAVLLVGGLIGVVASLVPAPLIPLAALGLVGVAVPVGVVVVVTLLTRTLIGDQVVEQIQATPVVRLLGLVGDPAGGHEDPVRESDGYYRVCVPVFASGDPRRVGESGYAVFLGGQNDPAIGDLGPCVLVRGGSPAAGVLTHSTDPYGCGLWDVLARLGTGFARAVNARQLTDLAEGVNVRWAAQRCSNTDPQPLFKGPWDSGEVLAVPLDWRGSLVLPPGCGLMDVRGLGCQVTQLQVGISLRPHVREAAEDPSAPDAAAWVAKLVAVAPVILPAVYESLLRITAVVLATRYAPLGLSNDQVADRDAQPLATALVGQLDVELPECVRELVSVSVSTVDVDPYQVSEDDRASIRRLEELRVVVVPEITNALELIRRDVRDWLNAGQSGMWMLEKLAPGLNGLEGAALEGNKLVTAALRSEDVKADRSALPEAEQLIDQNHKNYQAAISACRARLEKALFSLPNALANIPDPTITTNR